MDCYASQCGKTESAHLVEGMGSEGEIIKNVNFNAGKGSYVSFKSRVIGKPSSLSSICFYSLLFLISFVGIVALFAVFSSDSSLPEDAAPVSVSIAVDMATDPSKLTESSADTASLRQTWIQNSQFLKGVVADRVRKVGEGSAHRISEISFGKFKRIGRKFGKLGFAAITISEKLVLEKEPSTVGETKAGEETMEKTEEFPEILSAKPRRRLSFIDMETETATEADTYRGAVTEGMETDDLREVKDKAVNPDRDEYEDVQVTFGEEDGFLSHEGLDWSHLLRKPEVNANSIRETFVQRILTFFRGRPNAKGFERSRIATFST